MLTDKQKIMLRDAATDIRGLGVVEIRGTRGLAYSAKERMAKRLCEAGYLRPYVHGGYEITDSGRAALTSEQRQQSE